MQKTVIFVGGLIGTGKTSLARALAKNLDIPYIDVDKIKKEVYPTDPKYEYNIKNNIPFSDDTRVKVFNKVVEEMAELSKINYFIVVDETLHKKATREILFEAAKKYFGKYILVCINADELIIKNRLENNVRPDHLLRDSFGMYLSFKKEFEEFESPDLIIENNGNFEDSLSKLTKLVKEKIKT